MPEQINDAVFGPLSFDGDAWIARTRTRKLVPGAELAVDNGGSPTPPSDAQRNAYQSLLSHEDELFNDVQNAAFDYYNQKKGELRSQANPSDAGARVPEIRDSSEIWSLLRDPQVIIPEDQSPSTIRLAFSCAWNPNQDFEIDLIDNQVHIKD